MVDRIVTYMGASFPFFSGYSSIEPFNYSLGFDTWLDSGKLQLHVLEKYWILERALLKVFLKIEHLTFNMAIQLIFVFSLTSLNFLPMFNKPEEMLKLLK